MAIVVSVRRYTTNDAYKSLSNPNVVVSGANVINNNYTSYLISAEVSKSITGLGTSTSPLQLYGDKETLDPFEYYGGDANANKGFHNLKDVVRAVLNEELAGGSTGLAETIYNLITESQDGRFVSTTTETTNTSLATTFSTINFSTSELAAIGTIQAVAMVHDLVTDDITTLKSIMTFDYVDVGHEVYDQQAIVTDGTITLTLSVNGSDELVATLASMTSNNKRINYCVTRCMQLIKVYKLKIDTGVFVLNGINTGLYSTLSVPFAATTFILTGYAAATTAQRTLTAETTAFVLDVNNCDIDLLINAWQVETGTFTLTGVDVKFPQPFTTEWNLPLGAFTLPLVSGWTYNMTVNWGDGTPNSTITSYSDAAKTHTYATGGVYQIKINGKCGGWSINNGITKSYLTKIISWGTPEFDRCDYAFYGCYNLTEIPDGPITALGNDNEITGFFRACTALVSSDIPSDLFNFDGANNMVSIQQFFYDCVGLTTIPSGLFDPLTGLTVSAFHSVFANCVSITSIPVDLFRYNTLVSTNAFNNTFSNCTSITSIPADLFKYNTLAAANAFYFCFASTSITSIPADLFKYNINAATGAFSYTFFNTDITSIPTDLFRYSPLVSQFYGTFQDCIYLTSIPTDLFRYNTAVSSINYLFKGCIALTTVPTDIFRYNTLVWDISFVFSYCSNLTTIPSDIFSYLTACSRWRAAFEYCTSLTAIYRSWFPTNYAAASDSWFSYTFAGCSGITSIPSDLFYGVPDFGGSSDYFAATFRNCSGLTSIPSTLFSFGGASIGNCNQCFYQTFYNCDAITSVPSGLFPRTNGYNSFYQTFCDCDGLVSIPANLFANQQFLRNYDFYQTFYHCNSLASVPVLFGTIIAEETPSSCFRDMFAICGLLTTIADGAFGTITGATTFTFYQTFNLCTNLTSLGTAFSGVSGVGDNGFQNCFANCSSLTSVPTDLFKYTTSVGAAGFYGVFTNCSNLATLNPIFTGASYPNLTYNAFYNAFKSTSVTSIPSGFFDACTAVTDYGFYGTFENCFYLTSVPTDLFKYNTLVGDYGFYQTFKNCTSLTTLNSIFTGASYPDLASYAFYGAFYSCQFTSIPSGFFDACTAVSDHAYQNTFEYCDLLTALPSGLFDNIGNVSLSGFYQTFKNCSALTTVPSGLFTYGTNVEADGFMQTFINCTGLASIPTDLFRYCTSLSGDAFYGTFQACDHLLALPDYTFKYNTSVEVFDATFYGCERLVLSPYIFYASGEQPTRFASTFVTFNNCFARNAYYSGAGTAPDLWNCTFNDPPDTASCFGGSGNNASSLTNYASIPSEWL